MLVHRLLWLRRYFLLRREVTLKTRDGLENLWLQTVFPKTPRESGHLMRTTC